MANETASIPANGRPMVANKAALRQILEQQDQQTGFLRLPVYLAASCNRLFISGVQRGKI